MAEKSLQATPEGKKAAQDALTGFGITQKQLSIRTKLSLSTINNFFNCKPVNRILFVRICDALNLNWQAIAGLENINSRIPSDASTGNPAQILQWSYRYVNSNYTRYERLIRFREPAAIWLAGNIGALALESCEATLNQTCPDTKTRRKKLFQNNVRYYLALCTTPTERLKLRKEDETMVWVGHSRPEVNRVPTGLSTQG